jgi:hypothetical protein
MRRLQPQVPDRVQVRAICGLMYLIGYKMAANDI